MRPFVAAYLCGLALCSCGSLCDHAASAQASLVEKAASCPAAGVHATPFDAGKCEANDEIACTKSERDALDGYYACLEDVKKCATGGEEAFVGALKACTQQVETLSTGCLQLGQ